MSLRVALDVTTAVTQRAGVGRYTRELATALTALPQGPSVLPFYVAPGVTYPLDGVPAPVGLHRSLRGWRLEIGVRHAARRPARGPWDATQLYHAPDVVFPPVRAIPVVATVHDLSYVVHPQFHTRLNGVYLRLLTPTMAHRARLLLADSDSTRRDLVERLGVPDSKIRVVYPGVSQCFTRSPSAERVMEVRGRYGLTGPFILSVGTLEPRKNLVGTLRAYALLHERLPAAPALALVGGSGWGLDEQRLVGGDSGPHVRRLGYVSDADLVALYASCSVFVYPSFYEGWGLPVAEAMRLGAPTITSAVSSLPEVAGDAAMMVDPSSPEEIAAALERVLVDSELALRLRGAGPDRVRPFTAERCARETTRVYEEAVDG